MLRSAATWKTIYNSNYSKNTNVQVYGQHSGFPVINYSTVMQNHFVASLPEFAWIVVVASC